MTILVIAEHDNAQLKGATLNAVAAAVKLGGDVNVLVAGNGAQSVAEQASQATGVAKVLLADGPALAEGLAENVADQVLAVVDRISVVMGTSVSVRLGVGGRIIIQTEMERNNLRYT